MAKKPAKRGPKKPAPKPTEPDNAPNIALEHIQLRNANFGF